MKDFDNQKTRESRPMWSYLIILVGLAIGISMQNVFDLHGIKAWLGILSGLIISVLVFVQVSTNLRLQEKISQLETEIRGLWHVLKNKD